MKFVSMPSTLRDALATVRGALPKKHPTPVGRSVVWEVEGTHLHTSAGSLASYARSTTPIEDGVSGRCGVPIEPLAPLLDALDDALPVHVAATPRGLEINQGRASIRLMTVDPEHASRLPSAPDGAGASIDPTVWRELLRRSLPFAYKSTTTSSPLLGLHLDRAGTNLRVTATDGHRLAVWTADAAGPPTPLLLRAEAMRQFGDPWEHFTDLRLALHPDNTNLTVLASGSTRRPGERLSVTFATMKGNFPDISPLLVATTTTLRASRQSLVAALKRISALLEAVPLVILDIQTDQVTLRTGPSEDSGEVVLEECTLTGPPLRLAVDLRFLLEGLRLLPGDTVLLEGTESTKPLHVRADPEPLLPGRMLLMPMRITAP